MSIPRTLRRGAAVTRSDAAGMFAFVNVPDGPAQLLFRRVGYMPTVMGVALPQGKDSLEVALAPTTALLDTVSVTAEVRSEEHTSELQSH